MTTSSIAAVALALAIGLAACGGEEGSLAGDEGCRTVSAAAADTSTKPAIAIPEEGPPATLETCDVVAGDGPVAEAGQTVTVHYVGVAWSDGSEFDASWDGQPFSFGLGQGMVIQGWEQGVAGMEVGGRRELIIPPDLAYGEAGAGDRIGRNETLVFVVDLLAVGG